ncbi:MAG: hypothetical protein WC614_12400 [bacterium]
MIDGYIPEHSELRKVDWENLNKSGKLPDYDFYTTQGYLHLSKLPEQRRLGIFTRSMFHLIDNFRSSVEGHRHVIYKPCYYGFTTGEKTGSIENYENNRKYKKHLSLLTQEYRIDENKGKKGYIQNVVVYFPNSHLWDHRKYMKELEKYFFDSLRIVNFREKYEYKNLQRFKECWKNILVKFMKQGYSDGFLTSDKKALF